MPRQRSAGALDFCRNCGATSRFGHYEMARNPYSVSLIILPISRTDTFGWVLSVHKPDGNASVG